MKPEVVPAIAPPAPAGIRSTEESRAQGSACRVYVWASAHGIDLSYPGPLGSCTCSAKPHPEPPADPEPFSAELLRAKVREANEASRWGR
ncbi:hypothetical protein IPZ58_03545 [Streptomyces roseoverticillatus]|uniref:hypothetical protein n=1 Tax=Streptomyces roseoverticillatus TaxID=66429 RepID=UPI001F2CC8BD|nr:hypothetical protein [Streptomyces roseoverticillatus]MCF3100654.1 hypothetical protein [Streptomyces roseoverticillatus]